MEGIEDLAEKVRVRKLDILKWASLTIGTQNPNDQPHNLTDLQNLGPRSGHVTLGRPFKAGASAWVFHLVASRRLAQATSY